MILMFFLIFEYMECDGDLFQSTLKYSILITERQLEKKEGFIQVLQGRLDELSKTKQTNGFTCIHFLHITLNTILIINYNIYQML